MDITNSEIKLSPRQKEKRTVEDTIQLTRKVKADRVLQEHLTSELFETTPFKLLKELGLPTDHYAIFGSGPMAVHGLKDPTDHLNIVARSGAWYKAIQLGTAKPTDGGFGDVVSLCDGKIDIFNGWPNGDWNLDELIDNAEELGGINFVRLEDVLKWKRNRNKEGDEKDIENILDYLKAHGKKLTVKEVETAKM